MFQIRADRERVDVGLIVGDRDVAIGDPAPIGDIFLANGAAEIEKEPLLHEL